MNKLLLRSCARIFNWFKRIQDGREYFEDNSRSSCRSKWKTSEQVMGSSLASIAPSILFAWTCTIKGAVFQSTDNVEEKAPHRRRFSVVFRTMENSHITFYGYMLNVIKNILRLISPLNIEHNGNSIDVVARLSLHSNCIRAYSSSFSFLNSKIYFFFTFNPLWSLYYRTFDILDMGSFAYKWGWGIT